MGASSVSRQPGLDALRGIAISLVVAFHFFSQSTPLPNTIALTWAHKLAFVGWTGVDLFFVLSGFLIGGILIDHRSSVCYFTPFYSRRVLRIVPLYVASLCIYALLYSLYDWRLADLSGMFTLQLPVWSLLSFSQNVIAAFHGRWMGPGWLGVTWSLCVEEQFYIILPALIRLLPPTRMPLLCISAIVFAPAFRILVLHFMPANTLAPYVLLPGRIDALFLGVLAAWLWRDDHWRSLLTRWRWLVTAVFLLMSFGFLWNLDRIGAGYGYRTQSIGYTVIAFYYFLALLLVVSAPPTRPWLAVLRTPLCWAGLGAYSVYLFHRPIQGLAAHFVGSDGKVAQMVSLTVVAAVAWACWRFVERPAIAFGHRTFSYAATPRTFDEEPLAIPESA
jgi:peptidoglycan/LPS O-acetylase OafA/YrhL